MMRSRSWLARPTLVTLALCQAGCGRADLDAITRQAPGSSAAGSAGGGRSGAGGRGDDGGSAGSGVVSAGGASIGGNAGTGAAGAPACASALALPGDTSQSLLVDATTRSYVLHVPASYDATRPVPLVVDFHGIGESGASERTDSPYPSVLDAEGLLMAFPDGLKGPAGTAWNVGPCCVADVDDVAFARALVADVERRACVDPTRIYAVGVLTGGGMAHYLACHAADVFAAVAPAAFDLLAENVDDCMPSRPVSVISFRGTADTRVPYEGGPSSLVPGMPLTFLGAQGTYAEWAALDHCVGPASAADADGCSAYSGCDGGVEVILCTKQGGRLEPGDPNIALPVLERHHL